MQPQQPSNPYGTPPGPPQPDPHGQPQPGPDGQPQPGAYGQPQPGAYGQPQPGPYGPPNPYAAAAYAPYGQAMDFNPDHTGWKWLLFSFQGRIRRSQYWGAALASAFVGYGAVIAIALMASAVGAEALAIAALVPYFGMMWALIALQVKRWHDRGKSGAMIFINFIPFVGPIWSFIEVGCLPGTMGPNQYGPDPKGGMM